MDSATKNLDGMSQTKAAGNLAILVIRPSEVIAAIAALPQAYQDYYAAVADYNTAQFRLYHALGHPAHFAARQASRPPNLFPCCRFGQYWGLPGLSEVTEQFTTP